MVKPITNRIPRFIKNEKRKETFRIISFLMGRFNIDKLSIFENSQALLAIQGISEDVCEKQELETIRNNLSCIIKYFNIDTRACYIINERNFQVFHKVFQGNIASDAIFRAFEIKFTSPLFQDFYERATYYEVSRNFIRTISSSHIFHYGKLLDDISTINVSKHPFANSSDASFVKCIETFLSSKKEVLEEGIRDASFFHHDMGVKEALIHVKSPAFKEYMATLSPLKKIETFIILSPLLKPVYEHHFNEDDLSLSGFGLTESESNAFVSFIRKRGKKLGGRIGRFETLLQYVIDYRTYLLGETVPDITVAYGSGEKGVVRKDVPYLLAKGNNIDDIFSEFVSSHCGDEICHIVKEEWFQEWVSGLGNNRVSVLSYIISLLHEYADMSGREFKKLFSKIANGKDSNMDNISIPLGENISFVDFVASYEIASNGLVQKYADELSNKEAITRFFERTVNNLPEREELSRLYQCYKIFLNFIKGVAVREVTNFVEYLFQNEMVGVNTCYNRHGENYYTIGFHYASNVSKLFFLEAKGKVIGKIPLYSDGKRFITPGVYLTGEVRRFGAIIESMVNSKGGFGKEEILADAFAHNLFLLDPNYKKYRYYVDDFFRTGRSDKK